MAYRRLDASIAIPEPLTVEQEKVWGATLKALRLLKGWSKPINEGKPNQENTTATTHICDHENPNHEPCEIQEI